MNADYLPKKPPSVIYDNKYEFVRVLGRGGFGKVDLAREKVSNRLVAIKQLIDNDDKKQLNIIKEIQAVARFNHPGVVTYYHHFYEEGLLHLVMEYCEGGSLQSKIGSRINQSDALVWVQILAEALDNIHSRSIIHHDIKPLNILFTSDGIIKISDFGVANSLGGTRAYMAPEILLYESEPNDPRADIYALGVTLIELLMGKNPFSLLSAADILLAHDKGDFGIGYLPNWQQEIILRAINRIPELRFQTMKEFADAISAKSVPFVIDKTSIDTGKAALRAMQLLQRKNWPKLQHLIEYAEEKFPPNVNMMRVAGKFFLLRNQIEKAAHYYEQALKINPRLDIQKELGWINLEKENYPMAISMLSDHLHRNPTDFEAYNLLMQCFIETGRFETAYNLGLTLIRTAPELLCIRSNTHLAKLLFDKFEGRENKELKWARSNIFTQYNASVIDEAVESTTHDDWSLLVRKTLFHDFRYTGKGKRNFSLSIIDHRNQDELDFSHPIIKIGRTDFAHNHIELPGNKVSRRHCVIVNLSDDVMLYDLNSTGTFVNGVRVKRRIQLHGLNTIEIAGSRFTINTDKRKLL
jgi:serine/threonine protein kinase